MKQPKSTMNRPSSPLQILYAKQQPKVKANHQMTQLLKAYAGNDHKRIALLLSKWLKD
jgi:hypothetical protein